MAIGMYLGLNYNNINKKSNENETKININNATNLTNFNDNNTDKKSLDTFYIPPSDYVIEHINWSRYPDLKKGYVRSSYVTYTKEVGRQFIAVEINTEIISNIDNDTKIKNELYELACEAEQFYGPTGSVATQGMHNGAVYMSTCVLPYNMTINDLNTS
jgi:hypothetical protein